MRIPNALTIAGSDSGGGAGIQADLKTFSSLGCYGLSVITALTAQNTQAVTAIFVPPPSFLQAQLDAVFSDISIDVVKTGMLGDAPIVDMVVAALKRYSRAPLVVDPVMISKSGDALLKAEAVCAVREQLIPRATLITPNLPEAAVLLDCSEALTVAEMREQIKALKALGAQCVLLKGGHLPGDQSIDLFYDGEQLIELPATRLNTQNTHGTGCTLGSAVAAFLAQGLSPQQAVFAAKSYITAAIAAADQLEVGHGHGPVHHFHALWDLQRELSN